jgi:RNA recognition motif-containing protein
MQNKFQNFNQTGKNVLYVSDLPTNVTESDLAMFCKDFRENILVISFLPVRTTEYGKSISAKIIFRDPQIANEARVATNMRKIKGKTIRVMWDELTSNLRNQSQSNIFVKNIPFEVKPREFYELFLKFGDIVSSKIPEDEDGNHLGYGYINYAEPSSAFNAIQSTHGKEIWGSILEVKLFQKKSERIDGMGIGESFNGILSNKSYSLFLKNFPTSFQEDSFKKICGEYGDVLNCKIFSDSLGRAYAIVAFGNEESCVNAKNSLQGKSFEDGSVLFVDILMNKFERKKLLMNKIKDTNNRLNEQYKMCNLHIRNIPYHAKEEDLREAFEKFGPIKSVKIETYLLITKVNNTYKQIPTSRGFGYVCYEDPECAKLAIEQMSLKYLPKYETWNRPLLVDYFMPKVERNTIVTKLNDNSNEKGALGFGPGRNPMFTQDGVNTNFLMNFNQLNLNQGFNPAFNQVIPPNMNIPQGNFVQGGQGYPTMPKMPNMKSQFNNFNKNNFRGQNKNLYQNTKYQTQNFPSTVPVEIPPHTIIPVPTQTLPPSKIENLNKKNEVDEVDYAYFNSLDDESAQRDYLGELIFKKIENHELSQNYQFSIDTIGKITGMVLGIEDINEIMDIYKNRNNLTSRIREGMQLLGIKFKN